MYQIYGTHKIKFWERLNLFNKANIDYWNIFLTNLMSNIDIKKITIPNFVKCIEEKAFYEYKSFWKLL